MKGRVTLADVARRAGISPSTVSRALNGKPGVGEGVRQRVLAIAHEIGYLSGSQATGSVAILVSRAHTEASDPFYPVVLSGCQVTLGRWGYSTMLFTLDPGELQRLRKMLVSQQIQGFLLVGPDCDAAVSWVKEHGEALPAVSVDQWDPERRMDAVLAENEHGSYVLTRHLIRVHGVQDIRFVGGPLDWYSVRARFWGYRQAMVEAGLAWREPVVMEETSVETGVKAWQVLADGPLPQAVVAANDAMAAGVIAAAKRHGCRVPQDVRVVGFDDVPLARITEPALTTCRIAIRDLGMMAGDLLAMRLRSRGRSAQPVRVEVAVSHVFRESCGCEEGSPDSG